MACACRNKKTVASNNKKTGGNSNLIPKQIKKVRTSNGSVKTIQTFSKNN